MTEATTPIPTLAPPVAVDGSDNDEMTLEEVASFLGLPEAMLIRRIEDGTIPARKEETNSGTRYFVRAAELGIPSEEPGAYLKREEFVTTPEPIEIEDIDDEPAFEETPVFTTLNIEVDETRSEKKDDIPTAELKGIYVDINDPQVIPPPPSRPAQVSVYEANQPYGEISQMTIDPRELVAGLLDRWERTLEQRIYAEQRQRFETELMQKQVHIKQLQAELQTIRAEHVTATVEKDRLIADLDRNLRDAEEELDKLRELTKEKKHKFLWF